MEVNLYPIIINYMLSVAEMIYRGGYHTHYDLSKSNENSDRKRPSQNLYLIRFNREIKHDEVLKIFLEKNLRPATLRELLTFDQTYRNKVEYGMLGALGAWYDFSTMWSWQVPHILDTESAI